MFCLIKSIPNDILTANRYGNKGLGFPLTVDCGSMPAEILQECYLALELGDDPFFGSPLFQEQSNLIGAGLFAAPCLSALSDFSCYLAVEEDGFTPFDTEEPTDDFFIVPCV